MNWKGYFYPDESDYGFSGMILFNKNRIFGSDADRAGIDLDLEEKFVSGFFKMTKTNMN